MKTIPIFDISRSCHGCTACCDGWLVGEAYGHSFYPGRKCHFVSDEGCSIYEQRPYDPCHTFKCEWLINKEFPEWLKPSLSKVIFVNRQIDGIPYISANEMGSKMDSNVLSWFVMAHVNKKFPNIMYMLNGGMNVMGQPEFMKAIFGNGSSKNVEVV